MTAILKVDTIQDTSGNNIINENAGTITIGKSGDIVNLASGATAGFGKIGQVVQATTTTETSITSTSFADTGLSASITPSSTSSKILISVQQTLNLFRSNTNQYAGWRLLRDTTEIFNPSSTDGSSAYVQGIAVPSSGASSVRLISVIPFNYLDTPSTTSAITYKTQGSVYQTSDSGSATFQANDSVNDSASVMTLIEILG